ncbi:MAG: SpoIIIAH-like family protein [Lachnospiraceae bacterium]|jgi:stage III sporulation protein AH|nr:SpoIIIAH-like family protein [Lachnospiraceae bacterium]
MVKKNQIMITALAIMIAVAGYLNFAGNRISDEDILAVNSDAVTDGTVIDNTGQSEEVASMFEISDEDAEQYTYGDIESLDAEVVITEDILDEGMAESVDEVIDETIGDVIEEALPPTDSMISTAGAGMLSDAKLLKEQTRAKSKETLLEIINNVNISEEQKQEAVDSMIDITNVAEKETAAEILLEAKGFSDVVVSITDTTVDVVVNAAELTEAERAQIEDIVIRKTGVAPEDIIISTLDE